MRDICMKIGSLLMKSSLLPAVLTKKTCCFDITLCFDIVGCYGNADATKDRTELEGYKKSWRPS